MAFMIGVQPAQTKNDADTKQTDTQKNELKDTKISSPTSSAISVTSPVSASATSDKNSTTPNSKLLSEATFSISALAAASPIATTDQKFVAPKSKPSILGKHESIITTLTVLRNGQLASGSYDGVIKLWTINFDEKIVEYKVPGKHGAIRTLIELSGLDKKLAILSDGKIRLYDLKTEMSNQLEGISKDKVRAITELPNGHLAVGYKHFFELLNPAENRDAKRERELRLNDDQDINDCCLPTHSARVIKKTSFDLQISDKKIKVSALTVVQNRWLVIGLTNGDIEVWNLEEKRFKERLRGHDQAISAFHVLKSGQLLSGYADGEIRAWNITIGINRTWADKYPKEKITSLVELPDGRVASGLGKGGIKLWEAEDVEHVVFRCVAILDNHSTDVNGLAVLRDGRLVSASADKTINLWTVDRCILRLEEKLEAATREKEKAEERIQEKEKTIKELENQKVRLLEDAKKAEEKATQEKTRLEQTIKETVKAKEKAEEKAQEKAQEKENTINKLENQKVRLLEDAKKAEEKATQEKTRLEQTIQEKEKTINELKDQNTKLTEKFRQTRQRIGELEAKQIPSPIHIHTSSVILGSESLSPPTMALSQVASTAPVLPVLIPSARQAPVVHYPLLALTLAPTAAESPVSTSTTLPVSYDVKTANQSTSNSLTTPPALPSTNPLAQLASGAKTDCAKADDKTPNPASVPGTMFNFPSASTTDQKRDGNSTQQHAQARDTNAAGAAAVVAGNAVNVTPTVKLVEANKQGIAETTDNQAASNSTLNNSNNKSNSVVCCMLL
jgi:WD40 repeat protein/uncharacterized protein YqiB (DUF1249 family)